MVPPKIRTHGILMRQEKASRLYVTDIKQKLFLFDSVGFRNTTKLLEVYHKYDKPAFDDLFQLLKYGYVFDVDVLNIIESGEDELGKPWYKRTDNVEIPGEAIMDGNFLSEHFVELTRLANQKGLPLHVKYEIEARFSSIIWNALLYNTKSDEVYPLISISNIPEMKTPKTMVQNIMFENIPIPHPDTPLQHIVEFRSDPENQNRLLAFRSLVNRLSKSGYNEIEIKQEIQYLIEVYKMALEKHKISFGKGILDIASTAFTNPAALPKKIFDGVISIFSTSVSIEKAEMNFPGREISYVYRANQQFNPQ